MCLVYELYVYEIQDMNSLNDALKNKFCLIGCVEALWFGKPDAKACFKLSLCLKYEGKN